MTLLLLIDIPEIILVDHDREEQSYLTLMETTISHKLMNPLNSLSHQLDELRKAIGDLNMLIKM